MPKSSKQVSAYADHPQVQLYFADVTTVKDLGEMTRAAARALVHSVYLVWRTENLFE